MKYHATHDGLISVCQAVKARPDVFLYPVEQFKQHYAKAHECKKCKKILNA